MPINTNYERNDKIRCYKCHNIFCVMKYRAEHSESFGLNCSKCPAIMELYDKSAIMNYLINMYPRDERRRWKIIENSVRNCNCGGKFIVTTDYICPCCFQIIEWNKIKELEFGTGGRFAMAITEVYYGEEMWIKSFDEILEEELKNNDGRNDERIKIAERAKSLERSINKAVEIYEKNPTLDTLNKILARMKPVKND